MEKLDKNKEVNVVPFRDGTGPMGKGLGTGKGIGRGMGRGRGRMGGNNAGAGPSGYCVCPGCGTRVPHQTGVPCYSINCPKCGMKMTRG